MKKAILFLLVLVISVAKAMASGELIVNEFNCVGSEKYLNANDYVGDDNEDMFFNYLATAADPNDVAQYFIKGNGKLENGRIQGNGSDWVELVVTKDHLDIRGWQVRWAEADKAEAPEANGTDIWYGDGMVEQGVLEFSNDDVWSDLRSGTIITIIEWDNIYIDTNGNQTYGIGPSVADVILDMSSDTSFDPDNGDWWINVSVKGETSEANPLITSTHNVDGHLIWNWGCGNDNWEVEIYDPSTSTVVFGPVGEGVAGWVGGSINSREVGRLKEDPSSWVTIADLDEGDKSSFGMPNRWVNSSEEEVFQNFALVRSWYQTPSCDDVLDAGFGSQFDFDNNCKVDIKDLSEFMAEWLDCVDPADDSCDHPWES